MGRAIGVLAMEDIAAGLVEDGRIVGAIRRLGDTAGASADLQSLPAEQIADVIRAHVDAVSGAQRIDAVGIGFPGIVRAGVVEDSPNLRQVKGFRLEETMTSLLGGRAPVRALNDADAFAAGIAATRGHLHEVVRVWTLGSGVGFGRYPSGDSIGEGGHIVVTLDARERYCGCGGHGHLEGIVGQRAMRLRFLDLEPDEVFTAGRAGDGRCADFVRTWHRALAAATATSIHLEGPGRFFFSGPNARFVDLGTIHLCLHDMVQMSPLLGSSLEVIAASDEIAIVGAAVAALQAAGAPAPA